VAFRFQKANCVVVGTFNMYIVHPKWLVKHEIIEQGEVAIQFNLAQPGFRFVPAKHNVAWTVAPERVVIESEAPEMDCGARVAAVLRKLPETPLFAIGNNVVYRAGLDEIALLSQPIRDFLQTSSPAPDQTFAQRSLHVAVKQGEHQITNLQVSVKEDGIELLCNVHTELRDRDDANQAAVDAAERFFRDRTAVKPLIQHFFAAEIEHAPDNA